MLKSQRLLYFFHLILLFGAYFITARLGLMLGAVSGFATLVWPPTGFALSALLLAGYQLWPAVFLGAFLVNFTTGAPVLPALGMAAGNTLEALLGAFLLRRARFSPRLERLQDVLSLVFFAAILSTTVSALAGVTSLWFGRAIQLQNYSITWRAWWVGDALGNLVIAPFIMIWSTRSWPKLRALQFVEAGFLAVSLVGAALLIFGGVYQAEGGRISISYAIFPFVIWAALRFGQIGTVTATLLLSIITIWKTAKGVGPFAWESLSESLFFLQIFQGVIAVSGMIMAAIMTERRRAAEVLQRAYEASEARFKLLVDGIQDYAIFMLDPKGVVVSWNEGAERIKGYKAEEIIGKHFSIFYVPGADPHYAENELKIAKAQGRYEEENWRVRKDGSRFWAGVLTTRLDHEGRLVGFANVTRDLSERKRAENQLRESYAELERRVQERTVELAQANEFLRQSETRLGLATGFGKIGIWEWDVKTNGLIWNPENEILLGYEAGKPHRMLEEFTCRVHPDDQELLARASQRAMDTHSLFKVEFRIVLPNQTIRWILTRAQAEYDPFGTAIKMLGANVDVTESKRAVEERERLVMQLQAALESRDEFISIASHELMTPLTSLKMQLALIQHTIKPGQGLGLAPGKLAKVLNISLKQVDRLATLVNDLLDVSRIKAGRMTYNLENVNISDLLREVLDMFSDEFAQAKCSLELKVESNLTGQWDRSRIEQIALNLISNALKYARGSVIRVELTRCNDCVELTVQDFGPGIPRDRIDKIFERYERATQSKNISGLGLGLFISKRIVEGHHGTIQVESEVGRGTKFTVRLPLSPLATPRIEPASGGRRYGT